MRPNYWASSCVILADSWYLSRKNRMSLGFQELCQHQTRWIEDAWGKIPNCKLLLLQIVSLKALKSTGFFWRKALNSTQGKKFLTAWFFRCLYWCKKDKAVTAQLKLLALTVCLKVVLKLFIGLRVQDDWLELRRTNLCKTCHHPKVFLNIFGESWGGDQLNMAGHFLQEQKPGAIAALLQNGGWYC